VDLKILNGRYGPYVTDGSLNASIPRSMDPEEVDLDDALDLLEKAKARKGRGRGRRTGGAGGRGKKTGGGKKS